MKHLLMYFIGVAIMISLYSCKQKPVEVITMNNTRPIGELRQLVLKGDTAAYNELRYADIESGHDEEKLVYAIFMAHWYNYPPAYYDVYFYLKLVAESCGRAMDDKTKEMAIRYLKKAVELKDCSALESLSELCKKGEYVPKDTTMSNKLEEESKKRCRF
ncbi:hypothetical protein FQ707_14600 [Bacteroidaceae bacterium HV4-6-C5C]|nr:hypothetical protein FQ707_14600 [Bacteroidaceae bacterium HV4-6-C5C]